MIPAILSIRALYGIVPEINGIPAIDLLDSSLRREIRNNLHIERTQNPLYLPRKLRERLHLPEGVGLEVDYLA